MVLKACSLLSLPLVVVLVVEASQALVVRVRLQAVLVAVVVQALVGQILVGLAQLDKVTPVETVS